MIDELYPFEREALDVRENAIAVASGLLQPDPRDAYALIAALAGELHRTSAIVSMLSDEHLGKRGRRARRVPTDSVDKAVALMNVFEAVHEQLSPLSPHDRACVLEALRLDGVIL